MVTAWWGLAASAAWPAKGPVALDGPMAGLAFGMDADAVWDAVPGLRAAIDLSLEPAAFDAFAARHPEILAVGSVGGGGDRWTTRKSRGSTHPVLEGARWSVEVDDHGLSRVMLDYPDDRVAALTAAWGRPASAARWTIWLAPGVRAAWTGCFDGSSGRECTLELMPYRPVAEVVRSALLPDGASALGKPRSSLPAGTPTGDHTSRVRMSPYECSSGFVPYEVAEKDGAIVAYRVQLDWTYDTAYQPKVEAAVRAALGASTRGDDGCQHFTAVPALACTHGTVMLVTVGDALAF